MADPNPDLNPRGGTLSTLVSTKDMLEPGRDTVYIGAGQVGWDCRARA